MFMVMTAMMRLIMILMLTVLCCAVRASADLTLVIWLLPMPTRARCLAAVVL